MGPSMPLGAAGNEFAVPTARITSGVQPPAGITQLRYHSLDLWRGLAALLVCLFHAFMPLEGHAAPAGYDWIQTLAAEGGFGVQIFFVISGFCIGVRAFHEWQRGAGGGQFFADRLVRILPVYYASLGFMFLVGFVFFPYSRGQLIATPSAPGVFPASFAGLMRSVTLTETTFGDFPIMRVSWTLSAELAYYTLVCLGLYLAKLTRRPKLILAAGFVLAIVTAATAAHELASLTSQTVAGWRHFMCGFLVSSVLLERRNRTLVGTWSICGIAALGISAWTQNPGYWRGWMPAVLAIVLLISWPFESRFVRLRTLTWLRSCGIISYSIYLVHDPIVSRLTRLALRFPDLPEPVLFAVPLAGTVFAVVVAKVFFAFVESPVEAWRKHRRRAHATAYANPIIP